MIPRVKICGITRLEDAQCAVEAGADALGFMFYEPSPRFIPLQSAAQIIRKLPPFVAKVGVFVNADDSTVRRAIQVTGIDTLQFHGDESPEFCASFSMAAYKAFRLRDTNSLADCGRYPDMAWLLDSYVPGQQGGTGATFNWDLAVAARQRNPCIVLAGGLTPENAAEAVRRVGPYAVDVSSGVESAPGQKSAVKILAFIAAAKGARLTPTGQ